MSKKEDIKRIEMMLAGELMKRNNHPGRYDHDVDFDKEEMSNLWYILNAYRNQKSDSKFLGRSKSVCLIQGNPFVFHQGDVDMEIIFEDYDSYVRDGIKGTDIVVLWESEYEYVPITMKEYDRCYNKAFERWSVELKGDINLRVSDELKKLMK